MVAGRGADQLVEAVAKIRKIDIGFGIGGGDQQISTVLGRELWVLVICQGESEAVATTRDFDNPVKIGNAPLISGERRIGRGILQGELMTLAVFEGPPAPGIGGCDRSCHQIIQGLAVHVADRAWMTMGVQAAGKQGDAGGWFAIFRMGRVDEQHEKMVLGRDFMGMVFACREHTDEMSWRQALVLAPVAWFYS